MSKFFLVVLTIFLNINIVEAQLNIGFNKIGKRFRIDYNNKYKSSYVEIDNISFMNFDDNCKTKKNLNKKFYSKINDTLKFNFNYLPKCLKGNIDSDLRIRKIKIKPKGYFIQVFKIPRRLLKKIKYLELNYYYNQNKISNTYKLRDK